MGKNTSISLGDHFEDFIKNEVSTGRYSSASEVVRTALRLLEAEENKLHALRKAGTVEVIRILHQKMDIKSKLL